MKKTITNIVITGSSALSAAGTGVDAILELVRSRGDALTAVPFDVLDADGYRWGKIDGFKASDFMPPMKARKMDRCSQFAVSMAGLALKDAGLDLKEIASERVGIVLGSGFCGVSNSLEFLTGYFTAGVEGLIPMIFPNTVPNAPASNASIEHGFKGPNATLVQRFCSAESAFMMACRFIEEGRADVILTGGTDELIPLMIKAFVAMGQVKRSSAQFGEGGGMIVLESAAHAARRLAAVKASVETITTIGRLVPGREAEGLDLLTDGAAGCSLISLSGTAADMPALMQRVSGKPLIDIGSAVGRSLAMGAPPWRCCWLPLNRDNRGFTWLSLPPVPVMPSACGEARLFNPDPAAYLPHRYPFLLLDRVIVLEPGVRAVALTTVSDSRPFPQVLLVESVAQLSGIVTIRQDGEGGFLAAIDRAEFSRLPLIGDVLTVTARVLKVFGRLFLVEGEVSCEEDTLLKVQLTLGVGQL